MNITFSTNGDSSDLQQIQLDNLSPKQKKVFYGIGKGATIFMMLIGLPFMLIGIIGGIPQLINHRSASTDGQVTKVIESQSTDSDGTRSTTCTLGYTFDVDGKSYANTTGMSSNTYCGLSEGTTAKINYNPDDPTDNAYSDGLFSVVFFGIFAAVGLTMFGAGLLAFIKLGKSKKSADMDGDGMDNDLKPASEEQMKLIENGFRTLGQFYVRPNHSITQAEARETLNRIQQQIENEKPNHTSGPA